ncbi:hypothetical protein OFN48_34870, partial [Escherichia coli]|nr:hypothetical protein [Escherichia coli]
FRRGQRLMNFLSSGNPSLSRAMDGSFLSVILRYLQSPGSQQSDPMSKIPVPEAIEILVAACPQNFNVR